MIKGNAFSAGSIKIKFTIRYKLTTGQSVMQVHSSTVNTLAASGDQLSGETVVDPVEEASVIVIVGECPPATVLVRGILFRT